MINYGRKALGIDKDKKVAVLVGNPNVGKSVVFSALTGYYREVSNYPGTTVDISIGTIKIGGEEWVLLDTPGANSLTPLSEDEKVTKDIILDVRPDTIIQVGDGKNLKRSLMLLLCLSEHDIPVVLDINMMDETRNRLIDIDIAGLSKELGIPVVSTVAPERRGIKELKSEINKANIPRVNVEYHKGIEEAVKNLSDIFGNRGSAVLYLTKPKEMGDKINEKQREKAEKILAAVHKKFSQDINYLITLSIRKKAEEIYSRFVEKKPVETSSFKEKISDLTLRPITGIPIFFGVLLFLYLFVGFFGAQVLVEFLEGNVFAKFVNPWIKNSVLEYFGRNAVSKILVGEFGVITVGFTWAVSIILPIIATFFVAFSILEDCGYIPRLAAMADRIFRKVGLNGKAVLPMTLGFGCDTMATLTTRVLDTKKERVIATLMLALGIPCSAQLGVIFAIMATLPVSYFLLWIIVVFSQLFIVGWLASKLLPGGRGDFIMELPPLRFPKLMNVFKKTYYKVVWFFKEALPLFLIGTFFISILDIIGVLKMAVNSLQPVVHSWMGLPRETSVFFILGFLRRDFGAAGLFDMSGELLSRQLLVATVAITLFVPCIANFLMIIKERGIKTALAIIGFIIPFAFFIAGLLNWLMLLVGELI